MSVFYSIKINEQIPFTIVVVVGSKVLVNQREDDRNVSQFLFDCSYSKIIKKDLRGFHFY